MRLMGPSDRTFTLVRAAAAILMVLALGGLGPGWLPIVAILLVVLVHPDIVGRAVNAYAAHGLDLGVRSSLRRRWFEVSLAAIAVAGLAVQMKGVLLGVGHEWLGVDEERLANSVLGFLRTGALEHSTSEDHPGLHFWLLVISGLGAYLWALMTGLIRTIEDVRPWLFVGSGRVMNVVLAAGTTILTGLIGRTVVGRAAGLLAAGLFAFSPLSIETATVLRNDVGMVFFVIASSYAALLACERPTRSLAVISGALAGCAAGTKITAVFALVPALVAAAIPNTGRERRHSLAIVPASFLGALAITNHFIWSDVPTFLGQVTMDYGHVQKGHFAYTDAPRLAYASLLSSYGLGWPVMVCAAGFLVWSLAAGKRLIWVFLAFPVAYLWFMTLKSAMFPRWLYVLVPFIAVAGAGGLLELCRCAARLPGLFLHGPRAAIVGSIVGVAICLAGLYPIAWPGAIQIGRRFTAPTYALAEAWIKANVPKGDHVLAESGVLDLAYPGLQVVRVDDLRGTLGRNAPELRTCKWIVVPEYQFDIPGLADLFLVKEFVANPGLGGNRGMDVRVYVPQTLGRPPQ